MAWGLQEVVVAVAVHIAAVAAVLENLKEVVTIEAVGESGQNLPLATLFLNNLFF